MAGYLCRGLYKLVNGTVVLDPGEGISGHVETACAVLDVEVEFGDSVKPPCLAGIEVTLTEKIA